MPCEQALLELEGYRRANAAEGEQLAAELEASGAVLRRATRGCKLSVGALCKRSMGKTRKLIISHAKAGVLDWLSLLALLAVCLSGYRLPVLLCDLRTARTWTSVQT